MKARNKKTGEVVTNFGISKEWGTASYIDSTNTLRVSTLIDGEWEIIDEPELYDWQAFRRDAAKEILSSLIEKASEVYELESLVKEIWCKQAVEWADELIKQLKEEKI